jgi:hypothetical protein
MTCLKKHAMPLLEEIFDSIGHTNVFNILDLQSGYHPLPFCESDKVKIALWGIDVSRLKTFFRLANYYQQFIKGFNQIAKPLTSLLRSMESSFGGMHKNKLFRS